MHIVQLGRTNACDAGWPRLCSQLLLQLIFRHVFSASPSDLEFALLQASLSGMLDLPAVSVGTTLRKTTLHGARLPVNLHSLKNPEK